MFSKLIIIQPHITHYRNDFIIGIASHVNNIEIYCYENRNAENKDFFISDDIETRYLSNKSFGPFLIYNPLPLIKRNEKEVLILMLHIGHLTTWLLLLTKCIHRKKIVLWGHGISIKRYLKEEKSPSIFMKTMISLADTVWLYTSKELSIWKRVLNHKNIISLENTISGIESISSLSHNVKDVASLKLKHGINHNLTFIYCARFTENRRIEHMVEFIEKSKEKDYGFIVIGEGQYKPNFSKYPNVYDFGKVYDTQLKQELFTISDLYFQPAWVGLSIVEAMGYGKPIITFKRTNDVLQCVEYAYLNPRNSIIVNSVDDLIQKMETLDKSEIIGLSKEAKMQARKLTMKNMVSNAIKSL